MSADDDRLVHPIAEDARFRVTREMPSLSPVLEAEIERVWDIAQQRMEGALFNGRVFSADEITPHLVTGHWSEYRRVVAQMNRPDLFADLRVRSVAVGGVIETPDGIIFGRRPVGAIYQAGEWQLPPAGSVDPRVSGADGSVDVLRQFFLELHEELGLDEAAMRDPRLLAIVEHEGSHVMDLGIAVRTELREARIREAHARFGNGEYDPIAFVRVADLPAFLLREAAHVNLQAPVFLSRAGYLSG